MCGRRSLEVRLEFVVGWESRPKPARSDRLDPRGHGTAQVRRLRGPTITGGRREGFELLVELVRDRDLDAQAVREYRAGAGYMPMAGIVGDGCRPKSSSSAGSPEILWCPRTRRSRWLRCGRWHPEGSRPTAWCSGLGTPFPAMRWKKFSRRRLRAGGRAAKGYRRLLLLRRERTRTASTPWMSQAWRVGSASARRRRSRIGWGRTRCSSLHPRRAPQHRRTRDARAGQPGRLRDSGDGVRNGPPPRAHGRAPVSGGRSSATAWTSWSASTIRTSR